MGSNVLCPHSVTVRRASGEIIRTIPRAPPVEPEVVTVKFVQTVRVPRKADVFVGGRPLQKVKHYRLNRALV